MNLNEKTKDLKYKKYLKYLVNFIIKNVEKAHAKGVVFGLSGGIDSSLLALIIKKTKLNYCALIMPKQKNLEDDLDFMCAMKLVKNHALNFKIIELKKIVNNFLGNNWQFIDNKQKQLVTGNLIARLRMVQLYFYANFYNYLVIGSSNKCEIFLGYFTKFGDNCADIHPLANLNKAEIQEFAKYMHVDLQILKRQPSANLWKNQEDEKELNFSYQNVNDYLNQEKIDVNIKKRIWLMNLRNKHKLKLLNKPYKKLK